MGFFQWFLSVWLETVTLISLRIFISMIIIPKKKYSFNTSEVLVSFSFFLLNLWLPTRLKCVCFCLLGCFRPESHHEFRNNTLPLLPLNAAVRSFHLACTHCTGWIDFTLFGFDNHVYCAMKCGVAEGWQYPSTRGNLLTAGARWRYSLAQEHSAHSDTTASVCTPGSLAVIYDASHAITLSLTLIQQFIYWWHAYGQRCASRSNWGGGQNNRLPSASATSIVSQETNHALGPLKPDEVCFFFFF